MTFDVMIHEGFNANTKQIVNVYRVHGSRLSQTLRDYQNANRYIIGVIPIDNEPIGREDTVEREELDEELEATVDRLDDICIDPHGF